MGDKLHRKKCNSIDIGSEFVFEKMAVKDNSILFAVTVEEVQEYAKEKIGRELTEEELHIAKKGLESGLWLAADISFHTIITEMI